MTEINGAEIEAVDVITFGSPCQDLSVAGKRAGLKHSANGDDETTRSGLFLEAVRIIKEMRRATHGEYPKVICWENVPGAFSSNSGQDFRTVLEELIKIVEPEAPPIPPPGKAGWPYADCIVGDGWSLAWRVFDAQYWGVPQRRRRIYLVLDLTDGAGAEKILFEREGLRGHPPENGAPWQGASEDPPNRSGADDPKSGLTPYGISSYDSNAMKSPNPQAGIYEAVTSRTLDLNGGNPACNQGGIAIVEPQTVVIDNIAGQAEYGVESRVNPTLRAGKLGAVCYDARGNGDGQTANTITGDHNGHISDYTTLACYCMAHGQANAEVCEDLSPTLSCNHEQPIIFDKEVYNSGANAAGGHYISEGGPAPTLRGTGHAPGVCDQYIVRRLSPTECARLQHFPDRWGDIPLKDTLTDEEYSFWLSVRNTHAAINGRATKEYTKDQILKWYNKLHSDSAEYKMWGNGIALPCALYVMQGIAEAVNK